MTVWNADERREWVVEELHPVLDRVTAPDGWEPRIVHGGGDAARRERTVQFDLLIDKDTIGWQSSGYPGMDVTFVSGSVEKPFTVSVVYDPPSVDVYDCSDTNEVVSVVQSEFDTVERGIHRQQIASDAEHVTGVGDSIIDALFDEFGTTESVKAASKEELTAVPGIGETTAERILDKYGVDGEWEVRRDT